PMDPRLAVGIVILAGLAALGADRAQGDPPDIARPFKHFSTSGQHRAHVQMAWLEGEPEVWRDCRVCHAFEQAEPSRPQAVCATCHAAGRFRLATTPGSEQDLGVIRDATMVGGFQHTDHLNLECRACHDVDLVEKRKTEGRGWVPDRMPVPRGGYAVCAPCHDPGNPPDLTELPVLGRDDPERRRSLRHEDFDSLHEAFLEALNDSAGMGPEGLGAFLHADHLGDLAAAIPLANLVVAGPETDCGDCHAPAFTWKGRAAPDPEYGLESCGECHVKAGRERIGFGVAPEPRPTASAALYTFDHDLHLSLEAIGAEAKVGEVSTAEGYEAIGSNGCLACHLYAPEAEDYVVASPLVAGDRKPNPAASYEGCIECHAVEAWRTADGLHGDWSRKTEGNRAGACTACHVFGRGKLAEERRKEPVRRPRPSVFLVVGQSHPWITTAGGEVEATCAKCHLAPVATLPSRLGERSFDHGTHLPDEGVVASDCLRCHSAIPGTSSPAEIGLTYDAGACAECHVGAELEPDLADQIEPRDVLSFPHDRHTGNGLLGPNGDAITCITCHRPGDWTSPSIGITTGARNCSACHTHDAASELWRATGFARGHEITSCAECHVGGVPAIDPPAEDFPVIHTTVTSIDGSQIHPPAQACTTCHIARPSSKWTPPDSYVGTFGEELDENEISDIHRDSRLRGSPCIDCHFSGGKIGWDDPTTKENRARWGWPGR
ncbi:MAG: hypothetical protein O7B99_05710, partial [Planctomycetota bacterium]|nr:hypothetical protein [Planctomycetota bacterium]